MLLIGYEKCEKEIRKKMKKGKREQRKENEGEK